MEQRVDVARSRLAGTVDDCVVSQRISLDDEEVTVDEVDLFSAPADDRQHWEELGVCAQALPFQCSICRGLRWVMVDVARELGRLRKTQRGSSLTLDVPTLATCDRYKEGNRLPQQLSTSSGCSRED